MAVFKTQIQYGGPNAEWHDDADLTLQIVNRKDVAPAKGSCATGTTVTWSGPNGNGTITFFNDANAFLGTAQFPGEGPVAYRGQLKG